MVRTFGKVIGISVGIVAVVFLVVATILYRSGASAVGDEHVEALSKADSSLVPRSQPVMKTQKPEVVARPTSAPGRSVVKKQNKITKSKQTTPSARAVTRAKSSTPVIARGTLRKTEQMSPDEYVEREMYYVNKIGEESDQVLRRGEEQRAKLNDYRAELDDLLYEQNP